MELNPQLKKMLAGHFKMSIEEISINSSKDNIDDWDSLEHIKLILEVEEQFNVRFSLEVIPKLTSIKQIQAELDRITHGFQTTDRTEI